MQILGSVKVALTAMVVGLLVPAASAEVLKLDCGPADSPLAAGFVRLTKEARQGASQQFGWDKAAGLREFVSDVGSPELCFPDAAAFDGISGVGTLRIAVPAGRYRVHLLLADGRPTAGHWAVGTQQVFVGKQVVFECPNDLQSHLQRYWRLAQTDYHLGCDVWQTYIRPLFPECDTTVQAGQDGLEITLSNAFVCAVVIFPEGDRQGETFLKQWEADRRSAFAKGGKLLAAPPTVSAEDPSKALAPTAAEQQAGCQLFCRPTVEYVLPTSRPKPGEAIQELQLAAAQGEYESAVLNLLPLRVMQGVRLTLSELASSSGEVLPASAFTVRYAKYALARQMGKTWDYWFRPEVLVRPESMRLDFEPGTVRSFWLILHAPERLPQGEYRGKLSIATQAGPVLELPIAVRLHGFALAEASDVAQGMFFYAPHEFRGPQDDDALFWKTTARMLDDIQAHGCNGLDVRGLAKFTRTEGRHGQITGVDLADTSRLVAMMKQRGITAPVLLGDGVTGTGGKVGQPFHIEAEVGSPEFQRQLALVVDAYRQRARAERWPGYPDVWFWATDESGRTDQSTRQALDLIQAWRKIEGIKLLSTVNRDSEFLFLPYLNRIAPNRSIDINDELIAKVRAAGVRFGYYNLGGASPSCMRFVRGYYLWRTGADWFYRWHYDNYERDPFNGLDGNKMDAAMAYILPDDIAPTPIWEVTRQGINDYRYVRTLENWVAEGKHEPRAAAAVSDGEKTLAWLRANVQGRYQQYMVGRGQFEDWDTANYEQLRQRIAANIAQLIKALDFPRARWSSTGPSHAGCELPIRVRQEYLLCGSENDHSRCPSLLRLHDGRLMLGVNILRGNPRLTHDWNEAQRPHVVIGRTPEDLAATPARLVIDQHGLPPTFCELRDGTILCALNGWKEYRLDAPDAKAIWEDPEQMRFRNSDLDHRKGRTDDYAQVAQLLGLDPSQRLDTFGILQPIRILRSTDGGRSFEEFSQISSDPQKKTGCSFRGNMVELPSGELLLAACWRRTSAARHTDFCMHSLDAGRTWVAKGVIAEDPTGSEGYSETHLYRSPEGELVALMRTDSAQLSISRSRDDGQNWSPPQRSSIWGYPFHALLHSSGRVLLSWGYRKQPYGVKGKVLKPDLSDLETAPEFYIDQYAEPTASGGGYPAAVELPDGSCLVVYFARRAPYGPPWIVGRVIELR
jgi:hypothetical protein